MEPAGNVTRVEHDGREIYLVGTAHISRKSVEEVERVIDEVRPDTVCVELDPMRYEALVDDKRWQRLDVFAVIKERKVLFLLTSLALSAYQRKLGAKLGVRPGAELLAAVRKAEQIGARLVLADRNVQATLKRTWRNVGFWNKLRLTSGLVSVPFSLEEITEEKVEELKDRDTLSEMMQELARMMPGIKGPLIDERDRYLMSM
ncbi:MAG TPA: TraB domain-containing protein, partial [Polyangiaceae bacterium]